MGKFLRIFFGCHGRADRSFFFCGRQFPICARCTGELIGMLAGIPIAIFFGYGNIAITLFLMLPMLADGFLQLLTRYESRNYRRLITGIIFGIGFIFLLIHFHCTCVRIAGAIAKLIVPDASKVDRAMELFL